MQRPHIRLLRTNAFRLAALYMLLFATSVLALLAFIYLSTEGFIDRQTEAALDSEVSRLRTQFRQHGLVGLVQVIAERSGGERHRDDPIYLMTDANFHPLAGNLPAWPQVTPLKGGWLRFPLEIKEQDGTEMHDVLAETADLSGRAGEFHLLVGRDLRAADLFRNNIAETLGWASVLTLGLGVVGGLFMTRNMLRRVDAVNRTSEHIMNGDLSQRVPLTGAGDEFDQLSANLNAMLDQIERLMAGMRQVTDNIAHDLRTPLARLRARLEVTLLEKPDAQRYGEALRQTIAEADTLLGTFNALLSIAEAEAGSRRETHSLVRLDEIARSVAELYEPVAEERGLALVTAVDDAIAVRGDRHLLSQAIANLLDNALKYTPTGSVRLTARADGDWARLEVADTGPGVPAASRDAVLDRFVRLEGSRSTPGNGLGLSLVRAVARTHGGNLRLEDARPGAKSPGLRVILTLPLGQAPAAVPERTSAGSV